VIGAIALRSAVNGQKAKSSVIVVSACTMPVKTIDQLADPAGNLGV
jgi:hypothetical protein